mmetsp:Transcript_7734/g.11120  ORF Transcript_7734/g.11120 Transcript_7734/m.11120 type:complete len:225 (+) Transcript_7734:582-1256(+)
MLEMLESGENADVVFNVDGTQFPANKRILMRHAKTFEEIFENTNQSNEKGEEEISIDGVDPFHFLMLLRFLYSDEVPPDFHEQDHHAILEVANRFGCFRLKTLAANEIINRGVTTDNAAGMLLFADAQSCALLREKAIEVFVGNPKSVMASPGWSKIADSLDLTKDLMQLLVDSTGDCKGTNCEGPFTNLGVADLRKKLHEKDLDVDGTRKMLVCRLNEADTKE